MTATQQFDANTWIHLTTCFELLFRKQCKSICTVVSSLCFHQWDTGSISGGFFYR